MSGRQVTTHRGQRLIEVHEEACLEIEELKHRIEEVEAHNSDLVEALEQIRSIGHTQEREEAERALNLWKGPR